jgi:TRAP-type C4-dicarboxylate transport system substrate-binding protein
MTSVIELPFLVRTATVSAQILADLWEKYLQQEYQDVHVLYLHTPPAVHINTHSKPIRVLDDFKGMKIRTPTALTGSLLEALGATPIGMPANEIYQNMSSKVVDGFTMPFEALPPFRLHEVSKHHTEVWISGSAAFAMFMNKAKYAALPADVRQVLDETTARQSYWKQIGVSWDKAEVSGRQVVAEHKNDIYTLPPDERRRWREAARSLDEKWAAELEAKGLPGKELVREARALSAKYGEAD